MVTSISISGTEKRYKTSTAFEGRNGGWETVQLKVCLLQIERVSLQHWNRSLEVKESERYYQSLKHAKFHLHFWPWQLFSSFLNSYEMWLFKSTFVLNSSTRSISPFLSLLFSSSVWMPGNEVEKATHQFGFPLVSHFCFLNCLSYLLLKIPIFSAIFEN